MTASPASALALLQVCLPALLACAPPIPAAPMGMGLPPDAASAPDSGMDAAMDLSGDSTDHSATDAEDAPGESVIAALCAEVPMARRQSGSILELRAQFVLGGDVLRFGEANDAGAGVTVTPLNLRFYVSEVSLIQANGASLPVDIVTPQGRVVPYGVQLLNAEDPDSLIVRLLAPAGDYRGLVFAFGLTDACNSGPTTRQPPLSVTSQMTWPHEAGYLFFRYEALIAGVNQGSAGIDGGLAWDTPPSIHMGGRIGVRFAPTVRAEGSFTVAAAGPASTRHLTMDMNAVYAGALTPTDLSTFDGFPDPEVHAGERLRRALSSLTVFSLTP